MFEKIGHDASETASGDQVLRIYVPLTVGRDASINLGVDDDSTPTLFAPWDDLLTILQTPDFDGLGLWYFARAQRDLLIETHMISFSMVDTFAVYRAHNMSFYLGDGPRLSLLNIQVASGQALRVANAQRHDHRHFARPDNNGYVQATAAHGRSSSPVYLAVVAGGAAYIVDLGVITAWVHVPQRREREEGVPFQGLLAVAEALAYWVWQLWQADPALVQRTAGEAGVVEFFIRGARLDTKPESWLRATKSDNGMLFSLSSTCTAPAHANQADRDLVVALCGVLGAEADCIVERIAPVGPKGMIRIKGERATSVWADDSEPAWHGAEEALSALLDDLGSHLTGELGFPAGPIPDGDRFTLLTARVVPWLIDQLRDEIADLDGQGLLGLLVDRNEALIAFSARESELLPPRIACFGAADDELEQVQRRLSMASASLMTSRFLIEFASAFPPTGTKKLTRERYERLMALGSEIINKGMLAESVRSGVSGVHLSILQSGRLGTSRADAGYLDALEIYSQFRAEKVLADASAPDFDEVATLPSLERADSLAAEAFGFTYTELLEAGRVLAEFLEGAQTITTSSQTLHRAIVSALDWEPEKANIVLDALTLSSVSGTMDDFWQDGVNVAPWRFNRDRSYLKRPLVRRDEEVTLGRRAVTHAPVYWVEQYRSGRLRASGKMAAAMNEQRNAKGRAFEREVAALLGEIGYSEVRERLRRVASYDFRNIDGQNLGDIDVAAIHLGRRELLLIEAKDLEIARTPTELRNELAQLAGPGNSATARLGLRADWVSSHLGVVLAEFGVVDIAQWSVRTTVVVKRPFGSKRGWVFSSKAGGRLLRAGI